MITINDIQEDVLTIEAYYSKLSWQQFLTLAGQAYLKLDNALNARMNAPKNSGKRIDAGVEVTRWDEITVAMDRYARTSIPAWMYDEFNEYIETVLNNNAAK